MVVWYKAVCDHCGEACDVFAKSTFHYMGDHYLKEREKTIAEFLDRHYGHELRLIWRDDHFDRLWDEGYDGIHKIEDVLMLRDDSKPQKLSDLTNRPEYVRELIAIEEENHAVQMERIRRMCGHKWVLKNWEHNVGHCECSVCGLSLTLEENCVGNHINGGASTTDTLLIFSRSLRGRDAAGIKYYNEVNFTEDSEGYRKILWGGFGLEPPQLVF